MSPATADALAKIARAGAIPETRLIAKGINSNAAQAAAQVADAGGSPRAQIDAARAMSWTRLQYLPHEGKRERERRLARTEKQGDRE